MHWGITREPQGLRLTAEHTTEGGVAELSDAVAPPSYVALTETAIHVWLRASCLPAGPSLVRGRRIDTALPLCEAELSGVGWCRWPLCRLPWVVLDSMHSAPWIAVKLLSGGMAGWSEKFEPTREILIGRGAEADVRLHPTEDDVVGRKHARIFCLDQDWHIEALHRHGVLVRGEFIASVTQIHDGDVYMLGRNGPEFRVSLLGDEAPPTFVSGVEYGGARASPEAPGARPAPRPLRRVEFDPTEIEASVKQESRRTLRILVPGILLLITLAGLGFFWFLPRDDPLAMTGPEIQQSYRSSVFRAASTVRFRCLASDVQQTEWARYWITHGTSFAVGKKDG